MFSRFFRPQALRFSLTGERRLLNDEIGDQAGKIGAEMRNKKNELKDSPEKLKQIEQIKAQAHEAMRNGEKQMSHMKLFRLQTNMFLAAEGVKIDGKQAKIQMEMLKPDYIKTLIEKAEWKKESEGKIVFIDVIKYMETNKDDLLTRLQTFRDAFLQDPSGQLQKFLQALSADIEIENPSLKNATKEQVLMMLVEAKWITGDEMKAAMDKPAAKPADKKTDTKEEPKKPDTKEEKPATKPEEKKPEVQDTRLDIEKHLDAKRTDMLKTLQEKFDQFMNDPAGTFDAFKNAINQKLQEYPEKSVVHATDAEALVNVLYKANWITRRSEKDAVMRKLQPAPAKVVPSQPSRSVPEQAVSVESLERDLRVLRNAPVGSPDWNKAANARMQICVMQFSGKPGVSLEEKLEQMGGARTSDGLRVVDQRKMFYALRDYDIGGSFYEQGTSRTDMQDSIDRSKARQTGDDQNLDHYRAMQRVKRRYELQAGVKAEIAGRKEGTADTDRMGLAQDPNYRYMLEYRDLVRYHDSLRSHRFTPAQRQMYDQMGSFLQINKYTITRSRISNKDKEVALADIRRLMNNLRSSLGGQEVPQSFADQEKQMEKRYVQLLLDSPRFNDPRYLNDCFKLGVSQEDITELKSKFGIIIRIWDDPDVTVLDKQELLKSFDTLLTEMNRKELQAGGKGMKNVHYEDAIAAPRTVNTIPKRPNSYLANVDTTPPPAEGGDAEIEKKTSAGKMEKELDDAFDSLIQSPMYAPDADSWKEVWKEKSEISNPRNRIEEKRTLLKRMEATKSGDRLKEVMYRKDRYTVNVPLDRNDAESRTSAIMIWPKNKENGFAYRLIYLPATGQWYGDNAESMAKQYGIWVGTEKGTTNYGKDYTSGLTLHFTNNDEYVIQKTGTGTPFYLDTQVDRARQKQVESVKVSEVKNYAKNRWNFNLTNAVQDSEGKKFGYYYESSAEDDVVYSVDPSMKNFFLWNADTNRWDKIDKSAVSPEVLQGLTAKEVANERTLPKSMRKKSRSLNVAAPAESTPEVGQHPSLAHMNKLTFELQGLLSQAANGQRTIDAMDRQSPNVINWDRVREIETEFMKDVSRSGEFSAVDIEQTRELLKSMKAFDVSRMQYGVQLYGRLTTAVESVINKQAAAKTKLDGPSKGSEKSADEPVSKIRKQIASLAKAQESGNKESEKAALTEVLDGEFKEIFGALDEGDDIELGSQLAAKGLPSNKEFVAELKKYVPKGYYARLMK